MYQKQYDIPVTVASEINYLNILTDKALMTTVNIVRQDLLCKLTYRMNCSCADRLSRVLILCNDVSF